MIFGPLLRAPDRTSRVVFLLIILFGAPLTGAAMGAIAALWGFEPIANGVKWVGGAATLVLSAMPWLKNQAEWMNRQLADIEKAQGSLDKALADQMAATAKEIARTEQELAVARDELSRAEQNARQAEREAALAWEAVAAATPTRLLGQYVADRAASTDYRKHLGVLAVVRDDFEKLSDLIEADNWRLSPEVQKDESRFARTLKRFTDLADENREAPRRINRIVLYIDDLDRCPPDKVVEVLQAVHLLLAFPLFVVVVGVDSRWISRSLETRYRELLRAEGDGAAQELARSFGVARSEDYLEKIFQIPLWLQSMEPGDVRRMVQGLVRTNGKPVKAPSSEQPRTGAAPDPGANVSGTPPSGQQTPPPGHETQSSGEGSAPSSGTPTSGDDDAKEKVPDKETPPAEEVVPNVESLEIGDAELAVMDDLAPLLGRSPRALKRFVNVYRLVKARLSKREHDAFVQPNAEALADFELALILLAVDTGLPQVSRQFRDVVAEPAYSSMEHVVAALDRMVEKQPRWPVLRSWLVERQSDPRCTRGLHRSRDWVRRVSRFSFETAYEVAAVASRPRRDTGQRSARAKKGAGVRA